MNKNPVTLHIWAGCDLLASSSPFCLKVIDALKYKHVPFELKVAKMGPPKWARRGTLPVAEIGSMKVEDSTRILQALDRVFPESPRLYPEDPALRADTLLLEEWSDESFELFAPYYRWAKDHHWATFSQKAFASMPMPVRKLILPQIRKQFVKELSCRGIGMDTEQERVEQFIESISILEQRLSRSAFLVTGAPTAADFAVYPVLKLLQHGKISELLPHFQKSERIVGWIQAMENLKTNPIP